MRIYWYEDMKKKLSPIIEDISTFLNHELSESEIELLKNHLEFSNFRENLKKGFGGNTRMEKFLRKGQVGDWQNYFSEEMEIAWDAWIEKNSNDLKILLPNLFT